MKKVKKQTCYILIMVSCFVLGKIQFTMAQVSVSGKVIAEDNQPLPFANVLVLEPTDSLLLKGNITNEEGLFSFNIQPGNYILNISMIGYNPVFKPIEINSSTGKLLTEDFLLSENVTELSEIVVNGNLPLLEKQSDRTVINVQNNIAAAGNTVLEILEKSPGVSVSRQSQSIALNGKTGVQIMLNNKLTRLPADAVVQMLDGMSASNIGKIELITTPPAKYDAEGVAGIIHILTKKNSDFGTNGNFGVKVGYGHAEILGGNTNINHRSKRFNTYLNYDVSYINTMHKSMIQRYQTVDGFTQSDIDTSIRYPKITVQNLQAGAEFNFSDKTSLSMLIIGYMRKFDNHANTTNINTLAPDSVYYTEMVIRNIDIWRSVDGGLGFRHRFNERQELSMAFDYLYYHNDNPSKYNNKTWFNYSQAPVSEFVSLKKVTPIQFKIANMDYTNQFSKNLLVEAGLKGSISDFTNNVHASRMIGNEMVTDSTFTSYSNLDEKILASYISFNWLPSEDWNFQGGLRYEFADTYLGTPGEPGLVDMEYFNFFPNLLISLNLNQKNKLQLAYSKRITRPTYQDLAPFVFFFGYNTFVSGNLSLKPAISNGIDLSYQLKNLWITLKYNHSKDAIASWQAEFNEELNVQIYRSQNMKYLETYGTMLTFPLKVTPWWKMQSDISFYLSEVETQHLTNNIRKKLSSFSFNSVNTFNLPKNYFLEISGFYRTPELSGIATFPAIGVLNLNIQKKLKNDAVFVLALTDIFKTDVFKSETDDKESNSWSRWEYDRGRRAISLTYRHSFGNRKLKEVKIKSGTESERKRVQ